MMRKTVLAVTVMLMAGWLTFAIRSSVVEAQAAQGTFTFSVGGGGGIMSTKVDTFAETTSTSAGTWTVDVTKDVDVTSSNLHSILSLGSTLSSARVSIGGVTRRFQNGQIVNITLVPAVVPRETISMVFARSTN